MALWVVYAQTSSPGGPVLGFQDISHRRHFLWGPSRHQISAISWNHWERFPAVFYGGESSSKGLFRGRSAGPQPVSGEPWPQILRAFVHQTQGPGPRTCTPWALQHLSAPFLESLYVSGTWGVLFLSLQLGSKLKTFWLYFMQAF